MKAKKEEKRIRNVEKQRGVGNKNLSWHFSKTKTTFVYKLSEISKALLAVRSSLFPIDAKRGG